MKTYFEEHSDATRIFPWLADASSSIRCLCVVGEMLLFPEDIVQFKQISSEMFRDELKQKHALSTYRFYVVVCVGNKFHSKRIFDYYKLWCLLEREETLDGFTSRMEVPVQVGKEPYYVGIAEFGIEQLTTAIEMISDSPAMYIIICANHDRPSHCQELLDQVLDIGLTESGGLPVVEMVTTLTAQGYAVCTWGSSSEEQELQCLYTAAFL
ncbi:hypothetical protein [Exiguobacterium sp. UBA4551]|uniref:hypothetical protein n=1 Tax=Exiguobacterium sp. UBA4551 TaxID=1946494 RepID=UPI00257CC3DC|nr:hypothetical protein [Exiguobacterium sp. UBA4551]